MGFGRSLSKIAPVRSLWHKAKLAANAFFFARGGDEESISDHLVEVVRLDSAAACWFIQMTMAFSIVGGLLVFAACVVFLSLHWERCSEINRPVRLWLAGQSLLQLVQLPVRLVLFCSVRTAERADGDVEACVTSITSAPAWTVGKVTALAHYGWFFLGVVWWTNSTTCERCPGISMLLLSVLLLQAARSIVALIVFQVLFPGHAAQEPASQMEPATACQIAKLPVVEVKADGSGPALGDTCAVCLAEFEEEELTRRLPCNHYFHKGCIDRWLQRNKRCPLCMHPVDKPFNGHPRVHARIL